MPRRDRAADANPHGDVLLGEGMAGEAQVKFAEHLRQTWGIGIGDQNTWWGWRERATVAVEGAFFAACIGAVATVIALRVMAFALREAAR